MKKLLIALIILYASSYSYFRAANAQEWAKDKQTYVIYPATPAGQALYYLWRPLSYLDKAVTGRGTHIGQHRV